MDSAAFAVGGDLRFLQRRLINNKIKKEKPLSCRKLLCSQVLFACAYRQIKMGDYEMKM